jgi:hypothetical protein
VEAAVPAPHIGGSGIDVVEVADRDCHPGQANERWRRAASCLAFSMHAYKATRSDHTIHTQQQDRET